MKIKRLFAAPRHSLPADIALLLMRCASGLAFALHGWPKIQKPMDWMGPDSFAPDIFEALAAIAEFGGGIAWILGLLTPLASLGLAGTMVVAVYFHAVMQSDPFVASGPGQGSYELAVVYLAISLVLMVLGPGRVSADRLLFGAR